MPSRDVLRRCLEEGQSFRLVERITLERRDGRRYAIESTCAPIRAHDGRIIGAVLVFQDVSDKRLMALQLAHQATHDELTGLLNRQAFDGHLQRALEEAPQPSRTPTPSATWTSTSSSWSTTPAAIWPATSCSAASPPCSRTRCATPIWWPAWAATSSACC